MRQQSRIAFRPSVRVRVLERTSGRLIGHVRDLSEGGLRMATDEALEVGNTLALSLRLRNPAGEMQTVDVDAQCVWIRPEPRMGGFEAGFTVPDAPGAYRELIGTLRARRQRARA